jgi:anti-sigma-K factor RskA
MNLSDDELDQLLREVRSDQRPGDWAQGISRGLEARVLARLARRESWAEALFGLASWRPLFASAAAVAVLALWSGGAAAQLWDDTWLATEVVEEDAGDIPAPPGFEEIDF